MQTLYSIESTGQEMGSEAAQAALLQNIEQSRSLFTFLVHFIAEMARFSEKDAAKRAQKHLPTASDLNTNTKIAGNELVAAILENPSYQKSLDHFHLRTAMDDDLVKRQYQLLKESGEYREYIQLASRDKKSERKIVEYIFTHLILTNESFTGALEERYMNWEDDAEMMIVLMNGLLQKPATFNFGEIAGAEKMTFATELLQCVLDKQELCGELIRPRLKNWDPERIAALDMILMRMGVCEFLFFETIPPKVTINEYIDLAKEYSTEQSGHFVNGILDNIHKDLLAQDKIHKRNFKNSTL